jgi:hypothetical protein
LWVAQEETEPAEAQDDHRRQHREILIGDDMRAHGAAHMRGDDQRRERSDRRNKQEQTAADLHRRHQRIFAAAEAEQRHLLDRERDMRQFRRAACDEDECGNVDERIAETCARFAGIAHGFAHRLPQHAGDRAGQAEFNDDDADPEINHGTLHGVL